MTNINHMMAMKTVTVMANLGPFSCNFCGGIILSHLIIVLSHYLRQRIHKGQLKKCIYLFILVIAFGQNECINKFLNKLVTRNFP